MNKIPVILVAFNQEQLNNALLVLNLNNAEVLGVVAELNLPGAEMLSFGDLQFPAFPFSEISQVLNQAQNAFWLICGFPREWGDLYKTKKFLVANGVSEDQVVNFLIGGIASYWIANVRYAEKNHIDYFATGISYMEQGFDFNALPKSLGVGVNLSCSNQDLRQGYLTAKYVFEHSKKGSIKYVFIGLTPYSLRYDNRKAFSVCMRDMQYIWILKNSQNDTIHGQLLQVLINDEIKNNLLSITDEGADLNFDNIVNGFRQQVSPTALINWDAELKNVTKKYFPETVEENSKILEDYIKLCIENGAKPIGVMLPFAPVIIQNYDKEILNSFRASIDQIGKPYDFPFIDLFNLKLDYSHFWNMAHLNKKGRMVVSSILSVILHRQNILPFENLYQITYNYFDILSQYLPKDSYNDLMDKVFKSSVDNIRKKKKIKVAFVVDDASMWSGDDLYNFFAQNKRYEPTVFLCLRPANKNTDTVVAEFEHGIQQFKSRNINVVGLDAAGVDFPQQDIIFFLRPYLKYYFPYFQLNFLTAETLLIHIPYGVNCSTWPLYNIPIMHCAWKMFFETKVNLQNYNSKCLTGMPRGYYSGHPKLDGFFKKNKTFKFEWKMAQPNSKKIIWAPHWSISSGVKYATFQWNYQFMYEYAKSHPEISWVVKPHPHLLHSAVNNGIFANTDEFKAYLQKWNDLPNAKVVTGAYYHDIFATSDGMIQDCGSFIGEYQYTHKPMIYLTRDTQQFNELGVELMKYLYLVDGKDLDGIAALMQKIFIEGKDEMFEARKKFFDKYCNYQKANGMLASEFIFKTITQEFQ